MTGHDNAKLFEKISDGNTALKTGVIPLLFRCRSMSGELIH